MQLRQKTKHLLEAIRGQATKRNLIIGASVLIIGLLVAGFWPRTIQFSYSGDNCIKQLTLLPKIIEQTSDGPYSLEITETLDVAGYPVAGSRVCVTPQAPPAEGETVAVMAPFGVDFLGKRFAIQTPSAPVVSSAELSQPLPAAKPLELTLSESDEIFQYHLGADDETVECSPAERAVSCDLPALELEQGESHEIIISRQFGENQAEAIITKEVDILPAVEIKKSSVSGGDTVYSKPKQFSFSTNKELVQASASLNMISDDEDQPIEVETGVDGQDISVSLADELPRDKKYRLAIYDVESADGSTLAKDYQVEFELSGGPEVKNVSVASSDVDPNATVILQLDQALKPDQDVAKLVSFSGGKASVTADKDKIYVKLAGLNRCAAFSINVAKGLISQHEVVSDSTWKFNSRVRCHTISTIGTSVQGRPINAYYFGNGSQTILFTGAIHGSELSSKYVMDAWIAHLEANAGDIPKDKRLVVVPVVSPDSVAVASRYNSRNVNLNRNFPTHNWTSDIVVSGGRKEKGAGGKSALSEPEAAALARFTQQLNPRIVVTYHSLGSLVNGNDVGIANTIGPTYSRMTGYRYIPNAATTATFGFEMTGTYEDWLAERGTPAILIELNTNTGYHFEQNRPAMWAVVRG